MRILNFIIRINHFILRNIKYFLCKSLFNQFGKKSYINSPLKIDGMQNISIGDKVYVGYKAWLAALPLTGERQCSLVIDDECAIGNFNHIYCTKSIKLERGVLTADKVYISDNLHAYEDIHTYIKDQPIKQNNEVVIGEGSWLGENVCVLGAKIGKHCIVGSNSVVTRDIPDYSVVVGAPARVIKKYNKEIKMWVKINKNKHNGGGKKDIFTWNEIYEILVA